MCKEGTPVLALTGTADQETQKVICYTLARTDATKLFFSPNRSNLRFKIDNVRKTLMLTTLDWIVHLVKNKNTETPKTVIFCDTIYSLTQVVNYLIMKLGIHGFYPSSSKQRKDCLVGIFRSMTQEKYKKRIFNSLKGNGIKRGVVATSALSMGVNFPDIKYVVMYGPPRNLLDFHQQGGRAGRNGLLAHTVMFYYGQQVAHVEEEMRQFLSTSGCFRVASYIKFDQNISPNSPSHLCCNFCSKICACGSVKCREVHIPHEQICPSIPDDQGLSTLCRSVTEENKVLLKDALEVHQNRLSATGNITALGSLSCHGFSEEAISDVLNNCHKLFSVNDIMSCVPVFARTQAQEILSIVNEVFCDIDETAFVDIGTASYTDKVQTFSLNDLLASEFDDTEMNTEPYEYDIIE